MRTSAFRPAVLVVGLFTLALAGCVEEPHDEHAGHEMDAPPEADVHDHGDGVVEISDEMARRLGVTLAPAVRGDLHRDLRAPGEIVRDETRLTTVSLRFGGWVEALHVDYTGRHVQAGEPLMDVYSPELVAAQEDLLSALRLARELEVSRAPGSAERGAGVVDAARERLRLWAVPDETIQEVEESGAVREVVTLSAPTSGYVVERQIQAGERFESGASLLRLAARDQVWLESEIYERDLRFVAVGDPMQVTVDAWPGDPIRGQVSWIAPELDRERRTVRIRVELPNPEGRLRPGMFGVATTHFMPAMDVVLVPRDAVLHTGGRSVVFVRTGEGRFETRQVETGAEAGDRVEILSGVEAGEEVVARAGFVLDADSRLVEAMAGHHDMPGMDHDDHDDQDDHDDHTGHGGHDD